MIWLLLFVEFSGENPVTLLDVGEKEACQIFSGKQKSQLFTLREVCTRGEGCGFTLPEV
jgi:hypothetical protein